MANNPNDRNQQANMGGQKQTGMGREGSGQRQEGQGRPDSDRSRAWAVTRATPSVRPAAAPRTSASPVAARTTTTPKAIAAAATADTAFL